VALLAKLRQDFQSAESAVGYANLGMYTDALAELENLSPQMVGDDGVQEFKLRLLERACRWQDAAGLAARLATSHPDESRWFIAWAFAKRRSDSIETASKILTDAAHLHPKDLELLASTGLALEAILEAAGEREPATDIAWASALRAQHEHRSAGLLKSMRDAPAGTDARMHPNRVLAALRDALPQDAIVIADGGDFLSFARVGLPAATYLDPGSLGCIGVGTPFGVAAALACPDRTVVVATGDGAFGFNAMEIDTAVRHRAPLLIVVANNASWAIEVRDQQETHGAVVGTVLQDADHAAMARAFGMHAERVERVEDLPQAVARAMANRPALLDVVVTPQAASSDAKSGLAWVPDLQALAAWDAAEREWRAGTP